MTSAERIEALCVLGRQLARILTTTYIHPLTPAWEFVEPTEAVYSVYMCNRGTGARIYIEFDGYEDPKRITISGWFHIGKNGSFVEVRNSSNMRIYPTISVALSRGVDAIAKDISKRFLPQYLQAFTRAQEIVAKEEAYETRVTNTLKRVAHAADITVRPAGQYDRELRRDASGKVGNVHISIHAYESTVKLELHDLHSTQAEAVLQFLKTLKF